MERVNIFLLWILQEEEEDPAANFKVINYARLVSKKLEASKSQREIITSNVMFCFSLYLILSLDSLFTQEIHTIFSDAHPPRPLSSASLKDGSVQAVCHGGPTAGVQIICRSERADGPASPRQRHR